MFAKLEGLEKKFIELEHSLAETPNGDMILPGAKWPRVVFYSSRISYDSFDNHSILDFLYNLLFQ